MERKDFYVAFEEYYKKLIKVYEETFDSQPTVCYSEDDSSIDKDMILSKPNEEGESIWKIKKVENYDCSKLEENLGFKLCDDLKGFYTSYLFLRLAGEYNDITFSFDNLQSSESIEKRVLIARKDGEYYFENSKIFCLGVAEYSDNDSYVILYDNDDGRLFIYDAEMKNSINLDISLKELLSKMKAIF